MTQQPTLWDAAPRTTPRVLRVTELNRRVRARLDTDPGLADVWVEGEVSSPSFPPSGHCFFTLKDAGSQVRAVLFREELARAGVRPEHGTAVICHGRVRVYEPQGIYQLYVDSIEPAGAGDLHARYEQLRARLAAAGLFEEARKRPLPRWPRRIGVATSPVGAVWQDIRNVVRRRYPLVDLILAPASVQGAAAVPAIVSALRRLGAQPELDLIILARGGGSLEDLWAFNDERVVRAIVAAPVPVVVGVGHESDVTLADFAADVRAPTPSAAAELAVPDASQLSAILGRLRDRAGAATQEVLARRARLLAAEQRALIAHAPDLATARQRISDLVERGQRALSGQLERGRLGVGSLGGRLQALSPAAILERGYAVARLPDGSVVRGAEQATPGTVLDVVVQHAHLTTRVERTRPRVEEEPL